MKVIYKYPLRHQDEQEVPLPKGAEILTIQSQQGEPFLWALVDSNEGERRAFRIGMYGTGNAIIHAGKMKYISTVQLLNGNLVFHYFLLT